MHDIEIKSFLDAVPSVKSKAIVDCVNSLDVSGDHLRVANLQEKSFLSRIWCTITGETEKRNNRIAQSHQTSLENMRELVDSLTSEIKDSNYAITQVANRLTNVEKQLAKTASNLVETREAVKRLKREVNGALAEVNSRLATIDLRNSANEDLGLIMSRWEAGKYDSFPLGARCYVALHELYWGSFGQYCRENRHTKSVDTLIETLKNRATKNLSSSSHGNFLSINDWLSFTQDKSEETDTFVKGLAYLGDYADMESFPWVYTFTQIPTMDQLSNTIPQICSPKKLAGRLSNDVFEEFLLEKNYA